jgi:large subunit GTPase 1
MKHEKEQPILLDSTRICTRQELIDLFLEFVSPSKAHITTTIAMVGYPNVGKSSTINALCGKKKVAVAATPGKTKHFQTIFLNETLCLCDCPGLVFPTMMTTRAELVVHGILPIDQLREYIEPTALICRRIPATILELIYGIRLPNHPPMPHELLSVIALMRGFMKAGYGMPDESRVARLLLKDYVSGKLLYCYPSPNTVDPESFNRISHDRQLQRLQQDKKKPATPLTTFTPLSTSACPTNTILTHPDIEFFESLSTVQAHITQRNPLSKSLTMMVSKDTEDDSEDLSFSKKHFKHAKRRREFKNECR